MKYAAAMVVVAFATNVMADTPGPVVKLGPNLARLEVGPGMDAQDANLFGTKLVKQDLRGAIFDGCDLNRVYIEECDLTGASFKNARFRGSKIGGCKIEGADFTGAFINGLGDVEHSDAIRLSAAQLKSTKSWAAKDLTDCIIHGDETSPPVIDFRDVNLRGARLSGDLTKCDFYNVRFAQVYSSAKLHFDQFKEPEGNERICFANSKLYGTMLGKVSFAHADLRGAKIHFTGPSAFAQDIDYTDARISGCSIHLTQAQLRSTRSFKNRNLRGIHFFNVGFEGFDFRRQFLSGCYFKRCQFERARFDDADISRSNFSRCQIEGARFDDADISNSDFSRQDISVDQIKSTWNFKKGQMWTVKLSRSLREELKKAAKE